MAEDARALGVVGSGPRTVIENLQDLRVDEVIEQFDVTREQTSAAAGSKKVPCERCGRAHCTARAKASDAVEISTSER